VLAGFLAMAIRVLLQVLSSKDDDDGPADEEQASALEVTTPVWLQRLIIVGVIVMVAVLAWVTWLVVRSFLDVSPPPDAVGGGAVVSQPPLDAVGGGGVLPEVAVYVLVGLVLVLAVLVVLVALRRSPQEEDELAPVLEIPGAPLAGDGDPFAIDFEALEREAPRAAVIAAFAHAQRMLGGAGAGAQWDETSAEHVQRVGPTLPGAAPPALDHLLGLYHEAKFSAHSISVPYRSDAIAALRQLRDCLTPLATPGVAGGAR